MTVLGKAARERLSAFLDGAFAVLITVLVFGAAATGAPHL